MKDLKNINCTWTINYYWNGTWSP